MIHNFNSDKPKNLPSSKIKNPEKKKSQPKQERLEGIPWFADLFNIAAGESALWVAVIAQAMMDALSKSRNAELIYHKTQAIRWLTENNKDFHEVCLLADLDANCVRRKAKKALLNKAQWRAAPGKGKRYHERKAHRKKKETVAIVKQPPVQIIIGPWQ